MVLTLLLASMSAFVFAQIQFFGSKMLLSYLMLGMMFPAATAILPLFIKIRDFGLPDSAWGVILLQVAFGLGFSKAEGFDVHVADSTSMFSDPGWGSPRSSKDKLVTLSRSSSGTESETYPERLTK